MKLIVLLISRLVGIALLCLTLTSGWGMMDAHRTIGAETAASSERTLRGDRLLLPPPDWESIATLELESPGVCIAFAQGDPARLGNSSGHGILGVRERVVAFGGHLSIGRAASGVRVPLAAMNAAASRRVALA